MFLVAAKALAEQVGEEDLKAGALYPPLTDIRGISKKIARAVIEYAYEHGYAQLEPKPDFIEDYIDEYMYDPQY